MSTEMAAGQKDRLCGTCEHFDPRKPTGGVNENSGICRLRGPTVGHVATMVLGDDEGWVPTVEILTHWCAVDPEFDWCTQHQPLPRGVQAIDPLSSSATPTKSGG